MGYRETYNSDPVPISDPIYLANIANGELADNTYSIFAYQTSDAPSGVAVCLWSRVLNTGDACDISWLLFRFDGASGDVMPTLASGDTLGSNGHLNRMRDARDGKVYVFSNFTATWLRWDVHITQKVGASVTPTLPLLKWGGVDGAKKESGYDPVRNLMVQEMSVGGGQQGRIATFDNTDPYARISDCHTAGLVHNLFLVDHPYAVAVSRTGVAVTFNYETGQVIHATKHRPQLAVGLWPMRAQGI